MANPSLNEFIAQSQRGLYQSVFGDQINKGAAYTGTNFTTGTQGASTNINSIFTETYGRKVWQALNNQTRFFNAIPRVVWGNTAGWRIRTDRGNERSRPITETQTGTDGQNSLPTVDVSNIEVVSSLPRIVGTTFGASVLSVFNAQLEGGVGDVLAMENEHAQLDHMKEINTELLAPSLIHTSAVGGNATSFTIANGNSLNVGDQIFSKTTTSAVDTARGTIVSIAASGDGYLVTHSGTGGTSLAAMATVFPVKRGGFTSIEDIVAYDGIPVGGGAWNSTSTTNGHSGPKAYTANNVPRTAGGWAAAAAVKANSGVGRDISLNLLDDCIQAIRSNGGEPKVIIMGHDQYFKLERLLNSQQRYMGQEEFQVGVGSERTFPGTQTGLVLATYMGIPILPDADVAKSTLLADGSEGGSNVLVLDTDYIEMAIAQPTQYIENRDYFAVDQLTIRGLLYTMGEMRCRNFITQAKIMDLNA